MLVAEEAAYIDVVSRGRLELGLVKGYSTEIAPANINPASISERFWEAHDLIVKAMTSHDGDFNWEGNHFHFRHVNIWPRPYQQPYPPIWITAFTPSSVAAIAERGHVVAAGINARLGRDIFSAYRGRVAELGRPAPQRDRFGYMVLIGVGETEEEGHRFARHVKGYLDTTGIVIPPLPVRPDTIRSKPKLLKFGAASKVWPGRFFRATEMESPWFTEPPRSRS